MKPTLEDGRHLSREGLEQYLGLGGPAAVKIDGTPVAYLIVEPSTRKLSLRTPLAKNTLPNLAAYQNITTAVVHWEGGQWCQISIAGDVILDAYPLLIAVADRVQLQGFDFARATTASLDAFREVLAAGRVLSEDRKIGLFGELLVLDHLLNRTPSEKAVACWRGPASEEHDFDVGEGDVEVKTTTSEKRRHWVGSLGQLCPSVGRPLWLVSIQVTGAGCDGTSLAELVARIETRLTGKAIDAFSSKLAAVGWTGQDAQEARRLRYRSAPAIYAVDEAFPAITNRELLRLGLGGEKVVELNYLLDLSSVAPAGRAPKLIGDISAEGAR